MIARCSADPAACLAPPAGSAPRHRARAAAVGSGAAAAAEERGAAHARLAHCGAQEARQVRVWGGRLPCVQGRWHQVSWPKAGRWRGRDLWTVPPPPSLSCCAGRRLARRSSGSSADVSAHTIVANRPQLAAPGEQGRQRRVASWPPGSYQQLGLACRQLLCSAAGEFFCAGALSSTLVWSCVTSSHVPCYNANLHSSWPLARADSVPIQTHHRACFCAHQRPNELSRPWREVHLAPAAHDHLRQPWPHHQTWTAPCNCPEQ